MHSYPLLCGSLVSLPHHSLPSEKWIAMLLKRKKIPRARDATISVISSISKILLENKDKRVCSHASPMIDMRGWYLKLQVADVSQTCTGAAVVSNLVLYHFPAPGDQWDQEEARNSLGGGGLWASDRVRVQAGSGPAWDERAAWRPGQAVQGGAGADLPRQGKQPPLRLHLSTAAHSPLEKMAWCLCVLVFLNSASLRIHRKWICKKQQLSIK